jgi:hypothetical protein
VTVAAKIKRECEERAQARDAVPWWMGLSTIERAVAIKAEIEGQIASFDAERKAFGDALARLGFAGHKAGKQG